jgi:hypothetical protein
LYEGNGSTLTITNGIDLSGEGGMVWGKCRTSGVFDHQLIDTERGVRKVLESNSTDAEATNGDVSAFNSDGFSLSGAASGGNNLLISNGQGFVTWTFRKAEKFFDVVTWTGTSGARTLSHNLGTTPGMIIVKSLTNTALWCVYHTSLGATKYLNLSTTDAAATASTVWNDTAPTSTEFTVGAYLNQSYDYVAYLFAHDAQDFGTDSDESIIKCGSYTGDGTSDLSKEINLGWEPQFLMIKPASYSGDGWFMFDTMRGIVTGGNEVRLYANDSGSENAFNNYLVLTPTGFAFDRAALNTSSAEYVYMAIRRPHKPAEEFEPEELFAIPSQTNVDPAFNSGFPVDMAFQKDINNTYTTQPILTSRLIEGKRLQTSSNAAEANISNRDYDYNTGYGTGLGNNSTSLSWMWRRAPGFFDVVTYTGTGITRTISHNLGVAPEMMIFKCRTNTNGWAVYHSSLGNTKAIFLSTGTPITSSVWFNNTSPTDSVFTLGTSSGSAVNETNIPIISYHFASVPGISKVGSYTGTGANLDVDCGFTSGARFVLVKRTDSTGDWYLWDSVRGIVAGNDPYFFLNTTTAQVTSTDYIDPLSSGFTITSSAPAALNASGGTYLFYAIA